MDGVLKLKYFKKQDGSVWGFDSDQIDLIHSDMVEMTANEIDRHINPEKYLTNDEKLRLSRERMPTLSPIELDIKLNKGGLYGKVQELIKDNFELRIAYTRAIFFSRTDSFIEQARIALKLTDEQIDEMWLS